MKHKRRALFNSVISLLLCFSMLVGTTFAWFTDRVISGNNVIATGFLDVEMEYLDAEGNWIPVNETTEILNNNALWEPGYTEVAYLKISNVGDLALKYALGISVIGENGSINKAGEPFKLSDYIQFGVIESETEQPVFASREQAVAALPTSTVISTGYAQEGVLFPEKDKDVRYATLVVYMPESVGNGANYATGANIPEIHLGIQLVATQADFESDSFGTDYDVDVSTPGFNFPSGGIGGNASSGVTTDDEGKVAEDVTITGANTNAVIPAGVQLEAGTEQLTLEVSDIDQSEANVTLGKNEEMRSLNVHVQGVSVDNTVPMEIYIKEAAAKGLNEGNLKLYHVENGATVEMTHVDVLTAHNQFKYDPATGDITLYMATFSEVAVVADTVNAWEGKFDYNWYDASKTELTIANADQLAAFGAIVGGMNGQTQDSFAGKTVKLICDINLGDKDNANESLIFHPIGYFYTDDKNADGTTGDYYSTVKSFEGTFDGQGHTVTNFYQNTWEIKGDYDGNYYSDAMGLFGYVVNGAVKNLTVSNFSSDGEFTPTGVIAAYAVNSTFENIAITNCNPRVYNTGNGGIIGIAGNSNDQGTEIILKNITVDNSNKISALWGSWDVACGGLVGMFRGNADGGSGEIHFENCHVSAIIDVYNDVCANYQYYAYRYAGMIIGSVRHNEVKDGKTIPNMKGISANGCTVNYGTWNDYYYCELVANSIASYTHDHQFSRLTKVDTLPGAASGTAHYYVKNTDNTITCRHFIDGKLHEHKDSGTELVNGQEVLKEDKTCVYLPFDQMFTGYGWGVDSQSIDELAGFENLGGGIKPGDQQASDKKFDAKEGYKALEEGKEYKFSDLFTAKKDANIVNDAVTISVTDIDNNDVTVTATIDTSEQNWQDRTVTFQNTGKVKITIQDYQFCLPTELTVDIADEEETVYTDRFEKVFENTDKYLYRVGNKNAITISSLFEGKEGIGDVTITVADADVTRSQNWTYTTGTEWNNGKLDFDDTFTGPVTITISDDNFSNPVKLDVEVVDATNLTNATGTTTGGNFVLLCDVNTTTYVNYWNCTLYGNGFTYSLEGAPTGYNSKQGHGVIITKNATLDNLQIIGDVYNSYGAYTNQDYCNAAVDVVDDTTIQNCYIANCAAPVKARSNVTIKNTTLYGGAVANMLIMSGTATLENVTTANYDDGRNIVGMGIVIHSDATETAKLVLNGTLTQYNFISESKVPTDTYAKKLHEAMFSNNCSKYHFGASPKRQVNTGIISLTNSFNAEDITDNANTGYFGNKVSVSGFNGFVYTQPNTSGSVNNDSGDYTPTTQGAVPPSYSFDYINKNYVAKTDGSNDYCYYENGKVNISMDTGDTFNWDTSILTIGKGITNYTVSMNGTDYTGKSIAFNAAGDYTVSYTYTDPNNCKIDEYGNITTYSVTYTKTVNITVAVVNATTKHAEFKFGSTEQPTEKVVVGNNTYISATGVSHDNSKWSYITVNGTKIYYPIVEATIVNKKTAYFNVFKNVVTITDFADGDPKKSVTYNDKTTTMPSGLAVVKGHYNAFAKISNNWSTLNDSNLTYNGAANVFKYAGSNSASSTPTTYSNALCFKSPDVTNKRDEYYTIVQYSYTDAINSTYYYYVGYHLAAKADGGGCVTPDTLITLADGTQKRIDQVTYTDELLIWNFYTGEYDVAPASIVMNHGYNQYTVVTLNFSDGTTVNTINGHGFYDLTENQFVILSDGNADDYIGHEFVQVAGSGYKTVKLVDYSVKTEYTESWSVLTAEHYNCILENMWTITPAEVEGSADYLMPFEVGEGMKFDEDKMQEDIAKYGLYTYEDFEKYCAYEQFVGFGLANWKVAVGKGFITWDDILYLISIHIG